LKVGKDNIVIKDIFTTADVLLPDNLALEKWSVIACDQFSSQREYWERVRRNIGGEPSTFEMIIPEAYLEEIDIEKEAGRISAVMADYYCRKIFREIKDSFVYVERTQPDGRIRKGVVGAVDLDEYDFTGKESAIRASENTLVERLPARIKIRRAAAVELPHIMVFINDGGGTVIEPLAEKAGALPLLYDFELMEDGGHIRGMRVTGDEAEELREAMRALQGESGTLMVVGDGNHSLAAAKRYWDDLKLSLPPPEKENHPARRALVEINNVYDAAISFEAIHRVVWTDDPIKLASDLAEATPMGEDFALRWVSGGESGIIGIKADCTGNMLAGMQSFLDGFVARNKCRIDYIHGVESVRQIAADGSCLGLILPAMDKAGLFETVESGRVFPKKSFSVGHARDKRYYLECREIR